MHTVLARLVALGGAGIPVAASAALAPNYQNLQDLEVMVQFLRQHPQVAATVTSLDMRRYVIHYGKDCEAHFGREPRDASGPPMPGPQARLVFRSSTCPLTAR